MRIAPQGITGTNYLEIDYVNPDANPPLPIDWNPVYTYIPSSPSTVTQFVNAASEIMDRLHRLDVEGTVDKLNTLLVTLNDRVGATRHARRSRSAPTRVLDRLDSTLAGLDTKKISDEATALLAELRATQRGAEADARESRAEEASRRRVGGGRARAQARR